MVAIKYSLTQEDYDEIERERRGGVGRRIVRISYGVFAGLLGIYMIWQAIFIFPWKHPSANLLFVGMGLFCIWGGLEMPGLAPLFRRLSDPYAQHEVSVNISFVEPRERNWKYVTVTPGSERYHTIELNGLVLYDSRKDVPCDMAKWEKSREEFKDRPAITVSRAVS